MFVVLGVVGGVVWFEWWTPTRGVVIQDTWILLPQDSGKDFAATGGYILGAVLLGSIGGVATAVFVRPATWALLVAVLGATVAGLIMAALGHQLGPADPRPEAAGKADMTRLPGDLRVVGLSPYLAFPTGSLTALAAIYLGVTDRTQSGIRQVPLSERS